MTRNTSVTKLMSHVREESLNRVTLPGAKMPSTAYSPLKPSKKISLPPSKIASAYGLSQRGSRAKSSTASKAWHASPAQNTLNVKVVTSLDDFDERKESELEAKIAARKERDLRIKERQVKAMADVKTRMQKIEAQEKEE